MHGVNSNNLLLLTDRKRKFSRLPEPAPILVQNAESADESTSEESRMQVGFDINNKIVHVNIKTPLSVMSKEDYEAEYGDKCYVRVIKFYKNSIISYVKSNVLSQRSIHVSFFNVLQNSKNNNSDSDKSREILNKLPIARFTEISNYEISDAPRLPNSYIRLLILFRTIFAVIVDQS